MTSKNIKKKMLIKSIKYGFKKMRNDNDMAKDFILFLHKWGCIKDV